MLASIRTPEEVPCRYNRRLRRVSSRRTAHQTPLMSMSATGFGHVECCSAYPKAIWVPYWGWLGPIALDQRLQLGKLGMDSTALAT